MLRPFSVSLAFSLWRRGSKEERTMTPKEPSEQWLDPRSRMAELAARLDEPVHVSKDDPNVGEHLGGNRIFLYAENALYKGVQHLRRHPLHRPNLKALHLNSCVRSTQAAERAKRDFKTAMENGDGE